MINLSQAAAQEIRRMQGSRNQLEASLRIDIQPGGCSGSYYIFDLEEPTQNLSEIDNHIFHSQEIRIIISKNSYNNLEDLSIDFSEDLMGGGFRFHNPNASATCGCGLSFTPQ